MLYWRMRHDKTSGRDECTFKFDQGISHSAASVELYQGEGGCIAKSGSWGFKLDKAETHKKN